MKQMNKQSRKRPINTDGCQRGGQWAKCIRGNGRHRLPFMQSINHRDKRYSTGHIVDDTMLVLYGDRQELHCGKHSITYKVVQSLCCIPESNITLCVNYTSIATAIVTLPIIVMILIQNNDLFFLFILM